MMLTALLAFLGISSCATLTIVAGVVLGARRALTTESVVELDPARGMRAPSKLFPAFSH
ncbi:MAG TPA: hypothetical protein VGR78_16715 [Verrucomicrobiae bacterium]|nr:hypothetical protein [Verrucomicrobiae bacterium]